MTSIEAVATYLPPRRTLIADLAEPLGLSAMQVTLFQRYHRVQDVRWDAEASVEDLLDAAIAGLEPLRGNEHRVRYVLYARAFPVVVPFAANPLHDVCRARGLAHAQAFTVTQQSCASGLVAIDVAGRLLAADGDPTALALVLAGEKAFSLDSRLLPDTAIFSEGASACLIAHNGPRDRLLAYASLARGDFDGGTPELATRFQREYRACMAETIEAALAQAGTRLDEISLILPHNVNRVYWRRVCKQLGIAVSKVFLDNVLSAGHVFCVDAFLNYQTVRERGLLQPGDRYLVGAAGAGRGATFSAMVFEH